MLPDNALHSMNVMIATPCYISAVSMHYVTSLFELVNHAARFGLRSSLHMHAESLITRARNMMVLKFLEDDSLTHLFWIDSDIEFTPQSFCRLLLSDHDVAAGVYPLKRVNWPEAGLPAGMTRRDYEVRFTDYAFNPIANDCRAMLAGATPDGFVEVAETSTGYMCVKRDVILRMMKHYPQLNYTPDGPPNNPKAHLHWLLFDCMVDPDDGRYLSEDYAFCRRWRDMGGKIWVDLHTDLNHLGQHKYLGRLRESLEAKMQPGG